MDFLPVEKLEFAPGSQTVRRLTRINEAMTKKMSE